MSHEGLPNKYKHTNTKHARTHAHTRNDLIYGLGQLGVIDSTGKLFVRVHFFEQVLVGLHPIGHVVLIYFERFHAIEYSLLLASWPHDLRAARIRRLQTF